jgi:hypothetical protein
MADGNTSFSSLSWNSAVEGRPFTADGNLPPTGRDQSVAVEGRPFMADERVCAPVTATPFADDGNFSPSV